MSKINSKEFLDELIFCIEHRDIVKAKALLQFASDSNIDINVQKQALTELGRADEATAFPLLEYLTKIEISDPEVKDALYELILDKAYGNTDLVIKYITQEDKKNQLIYLRAAGDLILTEVAPVLVKIITKSRDIDILLQTIKSLGALRLKESLPVFSALIKNPDSKDSIKHEAIFAIAELAGKEAVDHLYACISGSDDADLIAIEAMAGIQDQNALETLASLLNSSHTHIRDAAIDQFIEIGNKSVPILTKAASNAESDYMVHLITTLGYIGDQAALPGILDIINLQPKDANIRQAAYEALERLPSTKSAITLAQGLQDTVEAVRMSAARAVDKNLSKVLVAGLKNIVRQENSDAENAVAALIDSEADNIFNFLMEEKSFTKLAANHVAAKASPLIKEHFLELLKDKGQNELAEKIAGSTSGKEEKSKEQKDEIFVVDDSKMMLKLYQNKLGKLGYTPTIFQFPEEAITAVSVSKPDLIITDLNMPQINGLQLTKEIRRKYTSQELPILMITTQSDFVETEKGESSSKFNESSRKKSGINKILHKPFRDEELEQNIAALLKKQ